MNELARFKERKVNEMARIIGHAQESRFLCRLIDELAGCVPDWTEEGYVKEDFMDNLGKLNRGEK